MADPVFGLGTILVTAIKLINLIKKYSAEFNGVPDEVDRILDETVAWKLHLDGLHSLVSLVPDDVTHDLKDFLTKTHVVQDAEQCLKQLRRLIEEKAPRQTSGSKSAWKTLKWTMAGTSEEVARLVNQLHNLRGKMQFALDTNTAAQVAAFRDDFKEQIKSQASEQDKRSITRWLEPHFTPPRSDPDSMQNTHSSLQKEGTCKWVNESRTWTDWVKGSNLSPRFLWIHGLPGTGKTILTSVLIDQIKDLVSWKGCSHYYCYHEHNQDETMPFLQWVIHDFCKQLDRFIPDHLYALWKNNQTLTIPSLVECLRVVTLQLSRSMGFSKRVYILVDAVDESQTPRDKFLRVLTEIGTDPKFSHISLLITSRPIDEIKNTMENLPQIENLSLPVRLAPKNETASNSTPTSYPTTPLGKRHASSSPRSPSPQKRKITPRGSHVPIDSDEPSLMPYSELSMDNHLVKKDIKSYIKAQISKSNFLRGMDKDVLEKIQIELADKAGGVFRIVACHLDLIRRHPLPDEESIRAIIDKLPPTIFEAYDKILVEGLGENDKNATMYHRKFARTALALICSKTSMIPNSEVLVEASRFEVPSHTAKSYDIGTLTRLLGCLTVLKPIGVAPHSEYDRKNEAGPALNRFSLAHYTVKEYLVHESTAIGKASDFALALKTSRTLELKIVFWGLQNYSTPDSRENPTRYEEYCLLMTDKALSERLSVVVTDNEVYQAVIPCLSWNAPHRGAVTRNTRTKRAFPNWAKLATAFEREQEPTFVETSILLSLVLLEWPELAKAYLGKLDRKKKDRIWKDTFALQREGNISTVCQLCVSNRRLDFLEIIAAAGATVAHEDDILYRALQYPYGKKDGTEDGTSTTTGNLIRTLLTRDANPNPKGYRFTPLQLAIRWLDIGWVQDLLEAGAEPRAMGNPKGADPPEPQLSPQLQDLDPEWFTWTPLKICNDIPAARGADEEEVKNNRKRIRNLLKQHTPRDAAGATVVDLTGVGNDSSS